MTTKSYSVGSKASTYWEYVSSSGADDPKGKSAWNAYSWIREAYRGPMIQVSPQAPPNMFLSGTTSAYNSGRRFSQSATFVPDIDLLASFVKAWKASEADLGVTLAEGKESLNMIVSKLSDIASSARALKRGNLGGAIKHLSGTIPRGARRRAGRKLRQGDVSGSWLALNLGWAPMISDIYTLANIQLDPLELKVTSPWRKGTASVSWGGSEIPGKVIKNECRSRIVALIRSEDMPGEYTRLGLTNPALIAWELVPFSFVVDYFLPIGDVIEAMEVVRIKYKYAMIQMRKECVTVHPAVPKGGKVSQYLWAFNSFPETYNSYRWYDRKHVVLTSLFRPTEIVGQLPNRLKQVANMAALTHQALLNLGRK